MDRRKDGHAHKMWDYSTNKPYEPLSYILHFHENYLPHIHNAMRVGWPLLDESVPVEEAVGK